MSTPYSQPEPSVAAGWYPEPHGGGGHRWWDGTRWTEHTQPEVARAPEAWTASPVSPGYGNPHDAGHAYQGVADNASYAPSAAYQAYPGADVSVGSGFASTSPATPYQSVGAGGTSPFAAPGYPSVGAGPAYPGAVTGYSTPGWSGYDVGSAHQADERPRDGGAGGGNRS